MLHFRFSFKLSWHFLFVFFRYGRGTMDQNVCGTLDLVSYCLESLLWGTIVQFSGFLVPMDSIIQSMYDLWPFPGLCCIWKHFIWGWFYYEFLFSVDLFFNTLPSGLLEIHHFAWKLQTYKTCSRLVCAWKYRRFSHPLCCVWLMLDKITSFAGRRPRKRVKTWGKWGSCESTQLSLRETVRQRGSWIHATPSQLSFPNGRSQVTGVTFSDSDSAPLPKFLNPGPTILSNLRIGLLFRLRLPPMQPKFSNFVPMKRHL